MANTKIIHARQCIECDTVALPYRGEQVTHCPACKGVALSPVKVWRFSTNYWRENMEPRK